MSRLLSLALSVSCASLLLQAAGCGGSSDDQPIALDEEAGILQYVPADTPYVFARAGELPDDLREKIEPRIDQILEAYHDIISAVIDDAQVQAQSEEEDVEAFASMSPIVEEFGELLSVAGLQDAGLHWDSRLAMYGVGLFPVVRVELDDEEAFEAAISRLEQRADLQMTRDTIDGRPYRFAGDDENGRLILGIFDGYFVMTIASANLADVDLKALLGLTLPVTSVAAAGTLKAIADAYDYEDYMVGFIDVQRMAQIFTEQASGVNAALFSMADYDQSSLSAVCKTEIREMAGSMPRLVAGYTALSASTVSFKAIAEMRSDLASAMTAIAGSVPGLGAPQQGLIAFGMSVDLLAAREFYAARLDAIEADPFECELFADLQNSVSKGAEMLNQPVPPIVYSFSGFLAVIEDFQGSNLAVGQPPSSVKGQFVVAMENVEGLLAMGSMFFPELAGLNLEPDGEPVRLTIPQVSVVGDVVHVAMTDNALAFSLGDDMQSKLPAMLAAPTPDSSPILAMDMDADRYYGLLAQAMSQAPDSGETNPEVQAAAESLMRVAQEMLDRIAYRVDFTSTGIEIKTDVLLKD